MLGGGHPSVAGGKAGKGKGRAAAPDLGGCRPVGSKRLGESKSPHSLALDPRIHV